MQKDTTSHAVNNSTSEQTILTQSNTHVIEHIIQDLQTKGYSIQDNFLPLSLVNALAQAAFELSDERFHTAGIGRQANFHIAQDIRRDSICWITNETPITQAFLHCLDELKTCLNRQLLLGLCDYEAHFAKYPAGGFYEKHLDAFTGKSNRVLSTVLYLNSDWQPEEGGELLLYDEHDTSKVIERILPEKGRFVVFLSECFYHQVNIANKKRNSIAGWFRRANT